MENRTYPTLPQGLGLNLKAVERLMEFDPGYLSDPRCPYSDELKSYLKRLVGPVRAGQPDLADPDAITVFKEGQGSEDEVDSLLEEIKRALNSMRRLQAEMEGDNVAMSDKITFLKNFGGLMDRFLSLKEKAEGAKLMYEFQRLVLQAMDETLTKDQIFAFKEALKKLNSAA